MTDVSGTELPRISTLRSDNGFNVGILDLGAAIQSIRVPTPVGAVDVVLGHPSPLDYVSDPNYLGSTVGRYANRIAHARFSFNGDPYMLDANEKKTGNCLHGGTNALHRQLWAVSVDDVNRRVECRHLSPAGSEGFPGELEVVVDYQIVDNCSLAIDFTATSDAETVVNLANHAYFNLDGGSDTIDNHVLQLAAEVYTPVDDHMIPTGKILPVSGTEFDFREPAYLRNAFTGMSRALDNNFVVSGQPGTLREAANLYSPTTGLRLVVHTTQPGLQVYTADHLGTPFKPRQGLCLEAQNFPDAPNQPGFPSARLSPGQTYRQRTVYEFIPPAE